MKYLSTIQDDEIVQALKDDYLLIKEEAKRQGVEFNDMEEYVFSNHIICLLKRLKNDEFIEEIDAYLMNEVDEENLEKAIKCIEPAFKKYGHEMNKSELFLVSTHIQMNANRMKEE